MPETLAIMIVLILILAVTLATVAVARGRKYWTTFYMQRFERVKISDVYPSLKTGDVIFFIATTHGFTNSMLTIDVFSHTAAVVERSDRPGQFHTSEANPRSQIAPDPADPSRELVIESGTDMIPLLTRLKYYTGQYCLMSLNKPLDPKRKREFEKIARGSCGYPFPRVWKGLAGIIGIPTASRHCYQHLANLFDQVDLSPTEGAKFSDSGFLGCSRRLSGIAGVPLGPDGDYFFHEPRLILYDIDAGPDPAQPSGPHEDD